MLTTFLQQPFDPAGRPQTLGGALAAEIGTGRYRTLRICVAFATSGGTSRLFGLVQAIVSGGGSVQVFLGVDNGITSLQAAEHLLLAGADVWSFNTGGGVLFHPKVYWLEGASQSWVSVGSSNLTSDGLYRNFETNSITVLDPRVAGDAAEIAALGAWFQAFPGYAQNCVQLERAGLGRLVNAGHLIDEAAAPQPQVLRSSGARGRRASTPGARIVVPPAPPPHPAAPGARTRPRRTPTGPVVRAAGAQFFSMTLSAFDSSHRSGVPGTPEVSLPDDVVLFFPAVSLQGRMYPDAYFEVVLNNPPAAATVETYRIWQRPPGSASGHADWRINVGHATIDQTTVGGGDILLFERLPPGSAPAYEVWTISPADPRYPQLLARCNRQVAAAGAAGVKQYGLF